MSPAHDILVVGSVALDSVRTPYGEVEEALGGSASYFSLAARHFAPFVVDHRDAMAGIGSPH